MDDDGQEHAKEDGQQLDSEAAARKKKQRKKKKKPAREAEGLVAPQYDFGEVPDQPPEDWVDVTGVCGLAAGGMQLGELVESPHFRLFDAMSAIEIMDPKMDSGFKSSEDMTLDRAQESGVVAGNLTPPQLVAIWDRLLMYYLLWLEGHTIVQTCFCCLYLHDLERLVKPVPLFGAFVDALLCACRRARSAVIRAGVFDDEDFLPGMFGIDLDLSVFSPDPGEVRKRLEAERASLSGDGEAAALRLQFLGEYMLALVELGEEALPGGQQGTEKARGRLTTCLGVIEKLKQTAGAAEPGELLCFDASINRKLLVPGPPRTVEPIHDSAASFEMWTSHIHELLLCGSLAQKPLMQMLEGAITYKDEPNVLPRSIAQLRASGSELVRALMLESLELYLFPREAPQHCEKAVEAFLSHCESLFSHLLKLAHANSARRFRRLAHVFTEFNTLQHEAWQLDEDLKQTFGANLRHPRPCWVWIMEHCLQMMITKLFLGFELDLYDQAEIHMIYWYVDYLYGLRIYNLNELHHAKEQPAGGSRKKPGGGGGRQQQQQQPGRGGLRPRAPPAPLLLFEATQLVVRGLFRVLVFCLSNGLLAPVGGLAQRFVLRFRSFEHFRLPHLPSFGDFEQSSTIAAHAAPAESRVVLDAAQASFTEAGQLLERAGGAAAKDAQQHQHQGPPTPATEGARAALKRVVVANQLAVTQLLRIVEAGHVAEGRSRVVAAATHHPHLVSLQVQPASGG